MKPSKLFNFENNLENDENIKKYGHHFLEYQSLNYFNFKNPTTKEFCEKLITLKINFTFLLKVSLLLLTVVILTILLFCLLNASFIKDNNGLLISACCFAGIALLLFFYLFYLTTKSFLLLKKILFFDESSNFLKLQTIKLILLVFFCSLANLIIFCSITFLLVLLFLKQIMNNFSKNYEIFNITKKKM
ncbi:MAG: hypothetical protein K2H56_02860 [Malacoplasma sp.]|nr:hypothetical protein [Malacoplasma sp.]